MKLKTISPLAAIVTALMLAPIASAQGAVVWSLQPDQTINVDSSDAGSSPDLRANIRTIESNAGLGPMIILSCTATTNGHHMLQVAFQPDPHSDYETYSDNKLRLQHGFGKLSIGDKKHKARFTLHPKSTRMVPKDRMIAKKVFNGIVRGDTISIKRSGKTTEFANPGKDPVFVSFAKSCPTTNGGKFDDPLFSMVKSGALETAFD